MSIVHVMDHPLIQHKLSLMRDQETGPKEFRELLNEISMLMAYEVTRDLPLKTIEIETPICRAQTQVIAGKKLAIVPILRAGLGMVDGTERGCSLRATGANANMARAQGINTNADKVLGLMLSNGLVAFSGALLTQYQGFVDVGMGRGAIVIGLAAVIIGEVVFSKIFHNFALKLLAVVIGAILYYIVIQVVLWLGLNTNDLKMLQALVVAMFLAVPYWKHRYVKKKGDANHG